MNFDIMSPELLNFLTGWGQVAALWAIGFALLTVLIHIVFALAVYRDAVRLDRTRALIIVGPGIWCIATLIGGVITAAIYWAMHHSRLNPDILSLLQKSKKSQHNRNCAGGLKNEILSPQFKHNGSP